MSGACGETIDPERGNLDDVDIGYDPGHLLEGQCIQEGTPDVIGTRLQCEGSFFAHIGFTYNDEPLALYVPSIDGGKFGPGYDTYEEPKVMACCGPLNTALELSDQPAIAENCFADFRQQACMSITDNLKMLIDAGKIPAGYKDRAIEVQNWMANHTTDCFNGLIDTNDASTVLMARWDLPNNGPWSPDLTDVYVQIDVAFVTDVHSPADNPLTCTSVHDNDGTIFSKPITPIGPSTVLTLGQGSGQLQGPASAFAEFTAIATACTDPWCSTAVLSADDQHNWSIDALTLRVAGDLRVSDGEDQVLIHDARLELQAPAAGTWTTVDDKTTYMVPTGAAHFIIAGRYDDDWITLPVPSSSEIRATRTKDQWSVQPFTVDYLDDAGQRWTLTVDAATWN